MNTLSTPEVQTREQPDIEMAPSRGDFAPVIGSLALIDLDSPTLRGEVTKEADEEARKQIVNRNANILKKRFGETFVKGERLDGGGYAGGGARELLAPFMEQPDFAADIKQLIPNRHEALATLKDNQDYITAWFEERYVDKTEQVVEQPKDPYELAMQAGYELTGPFSDTAGFMKYIEDFRQGEELCTFDDPTARLSGYRILWLRRPDADETLPADMITQDNLTEGWKEYLTAEGRFDPTTGEYDLVNLKPLRQDPYGTSSMSVQVSRNGTHVSIKNRYNHTVTNPDNTYSSDLDEIADGLRHAVYNRVGRSDLMTATKHNAIHDDYVCDNDGGLHRYYQVDANIYLGHYEYIEDGVVTKVDKSVYDMLTPGLYVSKHIAGKTIEIDSYSANDTWHDVLADGSHVMYFYDPGGVGEYSYVYTYDTSGNVDNISLHVAASESQVNISMDVDYNPVLKELVVAEGAHLGSVSGNTSLTKIALGSDSSACFIYNNAALTEVSVGKRATTMDIFKNTMLKKLTIGDGAEVDRIYQNDSLTELTIASGASISNICQNPSLAELVIPQRASIQSIYDNILLTKLTIENNANVYNICQNPALDALTICKSARVNDIYDNTNLTTLTFGEGACARDIYLNDSLTELHSEKWTTVRDVFKNEGLHTMTTGKDSRTGDILVNPALTCITISEGASVGTISSNHVLSKVYVEIGASARGIYNNSPSTGTVVENKNKVNALV